MQALKNIGYIVLSVIGLCGVIASAGILALIGSALGAICLAGFVIFFIAFAIKEHYESPGNDKDT